MAKIYIGGDHAGFGLKAQLVPYLKGLGHEVEDVGADTLDPEDDYPDFCHGVAEKVALEQDSFGFVIGGSGNGEAMAANRVKGARTAVFYGPVPPTGAIDIEGDEATGPFEIVRLARMHNNANILSLGARFLTTELAQEAVRIFLATPFSGNPRHIRRIEKI